MLSFLYVEQEWRTGKEEERRGGKGEEWRGGALMNALQMRVGGEVARKRYGEAKRTTVE